MPWLQVKVESESAGTDEIEEALSAAGAVSISYEDAGDAPLLEPEPGSMPLWEAVRLVALFPHDVEPATVTAALGACGHDPGSAEFERIEDREWERAWLDDWRPLRFGERLWVAPMDTPVPAADAIVVRLDPGLAFGTGTHATTALCLEWLQRQPLAGQRVLDFGCGSGILAIAALLLGAQAATAVDIDPQALEATRANAAVNGVADRLRTAEAGALPPGRFEFAVANILAEPLVDNAETLAMRQATGGRLALAGLLAEQGERVGEAFRPWYAIARAGEREGWLLLEGQRR